MNNTPAFNISAESFSSAFSPQGRSTLGITATTSTDSLRTTVLTPVPPFPVSTSPTPELDSMFDDVVRMAKKSSNDSDSEDESDDDVDGYGTGTGLANGSNPACQSGAGPLESRLGEPFGMVGDPPKLSLSSMSLNPLSSAFTRTMSSPLFDLSARSSFTQQKSSLLAQQPQQPPQQQQHNAQSDEHTMGEGQGAPSSPPLCAFVGSPSSTLAGPSSPTMLNGPRASLSLAGNGNLGVFSPSLVSQQESKLLPFSPLSPPVSSSLPSTAPAFRLSVGGPESSVLAHPTSQMSTGFTLGTLVPPASMMQQQQQHETLSLTSSPQKEAPPTHFVDNAPVFVPKSKMGAPASPGSRGSTGSSDDAGASSNLLFDSQDQSELSVGGLGAIDPYSKKDMPFRTKVCSYFYYTGHCQKGEQCNFSHEIAPGMEVPPLPSTTTPWSSASPPSVMSPTISPSGMPLSPLHMIPSCSLPVGSKPGMVVPGSEGSLLSSAGSPLCTPSTPFSISATTAPSPMMAGVTSPAPPNVTVPPVFCNPPPLPPYPYMGFPPPVDVALCGSPQKALHGKGGDVGPMGLTFAPPSMQVPHHQVLQAPPPPTSPPNFVAVQQLYRTKPCRFFFEKGTCLKGDRCNFSHDPAYAAAYAAANPGSGFQMPDPPRYASVSSAHTSAPLPSAATAATPSVSTATPATTAASVTGTPSSFSFSSNSSSSSGSPGVASSGPRAGIRHVGLPSVSAPVGAGASAPKPTLSSASEIDFPPLG